MSNPITDAMATLSVSQELALYQFLGVAVVDDLRAESEASAGKYPGLRREAITHCHQSLFDCGLDEVTNLPPTVKHNPPPETSEYMTEVAQYEPEKYEATRDVLGGRFIPDALYSCKFCAEECSWPAEDLTWSSVDSDWICSNCWDAEVSDQRTPGDTLADLIRLRAPANSAIELRKQH